MKTTALPDALHKDLLRYAAEMGMKVRTVVERAIVEYLKARGAKRGPAK